MTLARRLSLYAEEALFAVRRTSSLSQGASLIAHTAAFHYRNWKKTPLDPGPRLALDLDLDGYPAHVEVRPHDGDLAILYEVLARGAYRIDEALLNPARVRTVIDAGANVGLASLYLASRYRNARILAIEPNPDNFALLSANVAAETRIVPIAAAVTAKPGEQVFIASGGRSSHLKMNRAGKGTAVRGLSISELAADHRLSRIDLLKIDIEGAEREVFAEAGFLERTDVVVAELHGSYDLAAFNRDLQPWGFLARVSEASDDPHLVIAARPA